MAPGFFKTSEISSVFKEVTLGEEYCDYTQFKEITQRLDDLSF